MTKIYEANNHILIHAGYADPVEHSHMAAHIMVCLDGEMCVMSDGTEYLCHGIMIPSGISHKVDTYEKDVLVFLYDCTTSVAKQIENIRCLANENCDGIIKLYMDMQQDCTGGCYKKFETSVLELLGITDSMHQISDERVVAAMNYIQKKSSEKISCRDVAEKVHLSPGRFSHLFKEQVGMTFAAYVIYQRIIFAYTLIILGKSITEAALTAGFSSSAHFADVNRRVFGISAGVIIRDLAIIKV